MPPSSAHDLLAAADRARSNAYAPYSRYAVGAAVRSETGVVYAGANVENAAYPVGTCAEAGAIAGMIADGGRRIVEVLVMGSGQGLTIPCGACRQRLREFAAPDTIVHVARSEGVVASFTLGALLPEAFGPASLG